MGHRVRQHSHAQLCNLRAARLTGERPQQGVTPDSLLALHAAGYRAVIERLGPGRLLDVGCGQGFESVGLRRPTTARVVGVDYSAEATGTAPAAVRAPAACGWPGWTPCGWAWPGAPSTGCAPSHLIEHFVDPSAHVAEIARVLADDGAAFFLTPNEPADFENPFHVHLFGTGRAGRAPAAGTSTRCGSAGSTPRRA